MWSRTEVIDVSNINIYIYIYINNIISINSINSTNRLGEGGIISPTEGGIPTLRRYSTVLYSNLMYSMIMYCTVLCRTICTVCMVITDSKSKDQPGKVANPARGQLNREN